MPIVPSPSGPTGSTPNGYTKSQILQVVKRLVENKDKALDMNSAFLEVLQDFCGRYRWHWRRKRFSFQTQVGKQTYDLTDTSIVVASTPPALQNNPPLDLQKFVKNGVRLYVTTNQYMELSPVFEETLQNDFLEFPQQNKPSYYFLLSPFTFCFDTLVDNVYTVFCNYWAIPNTSPDSQDEVVPLVPGYLHHILIAGLKKYVYQYTLGEGTAKYTAASAEYEGKILQACGSKDFADGRIVSMANAESDAIQST